MGSIRYEEIEISKDELTGVYKSTSYKNGKNYAKIWYNGGEIDAERTYTDSYCKEHNLGHYADDENEARRDRKKSKESGEKKCGLCSVCKCLCKSITCLFGA